MLCNTGCAHSEQLCRTWQNIVLQLLAEGNDSNAEGQYSVVRCTHHASSYAVLPTCRSVLKPPQLAETNPPESPAASKPTVVSSVAPASPAPGDPISQACSPSQADQSPEVAADGLQPSPSAASPGRRHNVGPESTWAVRQSAELENLQVILNKQCFRRGQQGSEAGASCSEPGSASQGQDDGAEPR